MKLQNLALYLFAFSTFISCIALEDEFVPTVTTDVVSDKVYYYQDSFPVAVTFKDNALIQESKIRFQIDDTLSVANDTVVFAFEQLFEDVSARQLQFDSTFIIPSYVRTGKYMMEVSNMDAGENITVDTTYFFIGTDVSDPIIENFSVTSAVEGNLENDAFCRGEKIVVNASILDNVALKRFGISIADATPRYFQANSNDTVSVADIVQRQLFISDSLTNGTYNLRLIVEDAFGNQADTTTQISVNCDDQPAVFVSYQEENGIEIPSNRIVTLFPGEQFKLSSLVFTDAGGLDSARLEVSRIGVAPSIGEPAPVTNDTPIEVDLQGVNEQDLAEVFNDNFQFNFDLLNTQAGETIFINITVKDGEQTWEEASFFRFSLVAKEDLAPIIRIADLVIDGTKEYVPENEELELTDRLIGKNSIDIAVEGKVQENVGLASIEYSFTSDREEITSVGGALNDPSVFTTYPVDLGTTLNTVFTIDAAPAGVTGDVFYTLTLTATDIKGQTDAVTYNFKVTYPVE
ncbi:DUF4625 domain-containing protein [Flammeovirga aprica]|uniref:DUF4625 domain-containing protein n=1 Tax=Flammeovirga aprica JL-4 TaxID=694437 RepID=A0A7X9XC06_9BACT|nr:DUF4625 domain-containing protein [Flammeovirga aprica]NME71144.1 DUF4625 domain-containing protein [Flammeovirga aprica JL-4]